MMDEALCKEHTEQLKSLDQKFDKQDIKISRMYTALCGGLDENGEHVEGQLARWKGAHRFLKIVTTIMSAILVGAVGAAFKCAPLVMKASAIVESAK